MRMPDCRAATPRPFILQWDRGSSLRDVVAQFAKALDRFQPFWEVTHNFRFPISIFRMHRRVYSNFYAKKYLSNPAEEPSY